MIRQSPITTKPKSADWHGAYEVKMISSQHAGALKTIHNRFRKTDVVWAITGSLSFVLQGLELEVNDIDLQTDAAGAYEIERVFTEKIIRRVEFSRSDRIASHWGELNID